MKQYKNLISHVLKNGVSKTDRTGVGTLSVFGYQSRYDLSKGLPIVTIKKTVLRSVIYELLWFLRGDTNIKYLQKHRVKIWNEWADENGDLGAVYGKQWRSWGTAKGDDIDQINNVIAEIKKNPHSRRHIVNAWNVGELQDMALPPCHCLFHFYVADGKLSCQLYQRSADIFLGVPFNIASYSVLLHLIAKVCDLEVGEFIHTLGDAHIYKNHVPQCKLILEREPLPPPSIKISDRVKELDDLRDLKYSDIQIIGYQSHGFVGGEIAV